MFDKVMTKFFGSKHERDIKKVKPIVAEINQLAEEYKHLSDEELRKKTDEFKGRIREGIEDFQEALADLKGRRDERVAQGQGHDDLDEDIKQVEDEIRGKTRDFLDEILPEAFAVVKEACRRLLGRRWQVCGIDVEWDMVPFDVQLIGAIVLHQGKIAEMATGEGKTLVATMPIYLNALTGKGVHLVTVNDYLARRDAQWMGKIYEFLGLSVGCIQNGMDHEERRFQYNCDITYGTNNEFGFDYLRDNMAIHLEDRVQRGHHYAIVDEVDSVLVDEARTPLIISGPVSGSAHSVHELKPKVDQLVRRQTTLVSKIVAEGDRLLKEEKEYEAGIKLLQAQRGMPKNKRLMKLLKEPGVKKLISKVELDYLRDKRMGEIDDELYYSINEREHSVDISEKGLQSLTPKDREIFVLPDLSQEIQAIETDQSLSPEDRELKTEKLHRDYAERSERIHSVHQLLRAYSLYERDVEYVVQDGKVLIVDEFTGRLMPGRRYSDGLHQAIEAKEGVTVEGETQTLATITLQNYFRMYEKLAGMTGTAETEANEFWEIYQLDVVVIPTNEPVRRIDYNDLVYRTRREKYNAIIEEIAELHRQRRPVLVGTVTVDVSETLSRMLKRRGIPHAVLNAKYHQKEAEIVAQAGQPGAVTIATNMAGRGTDIKLGPEVVKHPGCLLTEPPEEKDGCPHFDDLDCPKSVPCGLHIIGTERHEARRIDRQLRGRSGRQGDPGSSRFYLSLEDDLMRLFGSDRISAIMDKMGVEEGEVIRHPMITRAIERAQKRVEAHNFSIRKHLLEYDDVMNQQREVIYDRRLHALEGRDIREEIEEMIDQWVDREVSSYTDPNIYPEEWNLDGLNADLRRTFQLNINVTNLDPSSLKGNGLEDIVREGIRKVFQAKEKALGPELMRRLERLATIQVIDERWREHLYELDRLREGIGLRAYGQKDPLLEYKREGYNLFVTMLEQVNEEILRAIFNARVAPQAPTSRPRPEVMRAVHSSTTGMGFAEHDEPFSEPQQPQAPPQGRRQPIRTKAKIGRNAPCPCGSGKKYKKCCMLREGHG